MATPHEAKRKGRRSRQEGRRGNSRPVRTTDPEHLWDDALPSEQVCEPLDNVVLLDKARRRNSPAEVNEEEPLPPTGPTEVYEKKPSSRGHVPEPLADRPTHAPAYLHIIRGPLADSVLQVLQGDLVMGRSRDCELRLMHHSVSRRHAVVMRRGDRFFLNDCGSQNGTYVNGRRVTTSCILELGDAIQVGNSKLILRTQSLLNHPVRGERSLMDEPLFRGLVLAVALLAGMLLILVWRTFVTNGGRPAVQQAPAAVEAPVMPPPALPLAAPVREAQPSPPPEVVEEAAVPTAEVSEPTVTSAPKEAPRRVESLPTDKEILAAYVVGDAAKALAMARRARSPLAGRLQQFLQVYEAARTDVDARNYDGAVELYRRALRIDGWLTKNGALKREIRGRLSSLLTIIGLEAAGAGESVRAAKAFERALSYDPSNRRARRNLESLRGEVRPRKATRDDELRSRRSAADAAFDD